jgi:hypothetical protein
VQTTHCCQAFCAPDAQGLQPCKQTRIVVSHKQAL